MRAATGRPSPPRRPCALQCSRFLCHFVKPLLQKRTAVSLFRNGWRISGGRSENAVSRYKDKIPPSTMAISIVIILDLIAIIGLIVLAQSKGGLERALPFATFLIVLIPIESLSAPRLLHTYNT